MDLIMSIGQDLPQAKSSFMPSCKSINEPVGGIFIATENMRNAEWNEADMQCGVEYSLRTTKEDPNTKKFISIPGRFFDKPRMLITRTSPLLKMNETTRFVEGLWNASLDKILKEERKASPVKRYIVFFLNANGEKMHKKPVQLTAKGNFLFHFDKQFTDFVLYMMNVNKVTNKQKIYLANSGNGSDLWFSANCIFEPVFDSQTVGSAGKKSNACITVDYNKPAPGECLNAADEEYLNIFKEYNEWYKKAYERNQQPNVSSEEVVYEELEI